MNTEEYWRLLVTAWINLGIFNLQDGSQDGDINTLQVQKRMEFNSTAEAHHDTQTLRDIITIKERSLSPSPSNPIEIVERPLTHKPVLYDLDTAERISRVHEVPKTLYQTRMEAECQRICAPMIDEWRECMSRDLSNLSNKLPQCSWICTPLDVECIKNVVTELHGQREAIRVVTEVLGLNWRCSVTGRIEYARSSRPEIDWATMLAPDERVVKVDDLLNIILTSARCLYNADGPVLTTDVSWFSLLTSEQLIHSENAHTLQMVSNLNPLLSARVVQRDYRAIMGYNAMMPERMVTAQHLQYVNWAHRRGGKRGECCSSYRRLAVTFQRHCEQNGAFFRVMWNEHDHSDSQGMYIVYYSLIKYIIFQFYIIAYNSIYVNIMYVL